MKRMLKGVGYLTGFGTLSTSSLIYYNKDEYDLKFSQVFKGFRSSLRIAETGVRIAYLYKNPFDKSTTEEKNIKSGRIICETFSKCGGIYIKLGQSFALTEILLPKEFCEQFYSLFQEAPVSDFKSIKETIEKDLKTSLNNVFEEFQESPINSASIAQVHVAKLKKNGEKVAIKVQHQGLRESIGFSIFLIDSMVKIGSYLFNDFNYKWLIDNMKETLPKELDFQNERNNIFKVRSILKENSGVTVPTVYDEYSTNQVITMGFVEGFNINNIEKLRENSIDLKKVAKTLAKTFAKMTFEHGLVHGDPHPGNIFVRPKNNKTTSWLQKLKNYIFKPNNFEIVLLDNGLYSELTENIQNAYAQIWVGIIKRDEELIKTACKNLGVENEYKLFASMITNQSYENIMDNNGSDIKIRLKGNLNLDEKRKLNNKKIVIFRERIVRCLEKMNRELVLLFKINYYINSIDMMLGTPINNYVYILKYATKRVRKSQNLPFFSKIKANITDSIDLMKIKLYSLIIEITTY